ncbi:MAG: histone H1 [Stenotrophobium sp.]
MKTPKRPRDTNQLAKFIVDVATGDVEDAPRKADADKDPAAVALGRKGGLKGGKARAEALSPKKRSEIAKKAAAARWKKP